MMLFGGYAVEISVEIIIDFHDEVFHRRHIGISYVEPDGVSSSAVVVTNSDFDVAAVIYFSSDNITICRIKKR